MVLQQDADIKLINTIDERSSLLKTNGLDSVVVQPFTKEFSRMTAVEFVRDILVNQLKVKKVVVGYDHRFGRNRTASIKELIEFGQTFGFEVEQIEAQEVDEVSVSSTKIRNALQLGDVAKANSYLGYAFMITGRVKRGRALGRTIGFPTANLHIEESYKLIPANGVYVIASVIAGKKVFGMMNIGLNPTVDGTQKTIEVHFFDFDKDLYDQEICVSLYHRLRSEQDFKYIDKLKAQLEKDRQAALAYLSNHVE